MPRTIKRTAAGGILAVLAAAAVGSATTASAATSASAGPLGTASSPSQVGRFPHPLQTNARYFPLVPGTRFVFDGTIIDADGTHPHQVIMTVTNLVKEVDGVMSRVILDEDVIDGVLTEVELAFFAQDASDNVWTMGEYPEEFENGRFAGAPNTWISGSRRAEAGILIPGQPRTGMGTFVQGFAPSVGFYDVGTVVADGLRVCAAGTCYDNVVKIRETAPNAPADGFQLKFYAPGAGLVRVTAAGGNSQEDMVRISARRLGRDEMSDVRDTVMRMEARAYRISKDYRTTGPARPE